MLNFSLLLEYISDWNLCIKRSEWRHISRAVIQGWINFLRLSRKFSIASIFSVVGDVRSEAASTSKEPQTWILKTNSEAISPSTTPSNRTRRIRYGSMEAERPQNEVRLRRSGDLRTWRWKWTNITSKWVETFSLIHQEFWFVLTRRLWDTKWAQVLKKLAQDFDDIGLRSIAMNCLWGRWRFAGRSHIRIWIESRRSIWNDDRSTGRRNRTQTFLCEMKPEAAEKRERTSILELFIHISCSFSGNWRSRRTFDSWRQIWVRFEHIRCQLFALKGKLEINGHWTDVRLITRSSSRLRTELLNVYCQDKTSGDTDVVCVSHRHWWHHSGHASLILNFVAWMPFAKEVFRIVVWLSASTVCITVLNIVP